MLKGKHIAKGVTAICVPGSSQVKRAAEAEGIDRVFTDAGFEWRESGCSMCFYSGGESFGEGRTRHLVNQSQFRKPPGTQCQNAYRQPRDSGGQRIGRRHCRPKGGTVMAEPLTTLTALPAPFLRDNVDTDQIIPSREMKSTGKTGLADGLFAGHRYTKIGGRDPDPDFVLNTPAYSDSQVLLSGRNFGCGSSPRTCGMGAR